MKIEQIGAIIALILVFVLCFNEPRLFPYAAVGLATGIGLRMIMNGRNKDKPEKGK